jgi:predicted nucleic acid-binding Zn ribbon protein
MPTYKFRCNDTNRRFEIKFKTIAEYEAATITSPFTGSTNVTRIIDRVIVKKSGGIGLDALMSGDESALESLEHADPQTLGRSLRAMAAETGEDMGGEFNEIVSRLEAGDSPEEIEASLPPESSMTDL